MPDLTEFENEWTAIAQMAGTSVTRTPELLCSLKASISSIMSEFEKQVKTSSRTSMPSERDRQKLKRIAMKSNRIIAPKLTTKLNQHLTSPVWSETISREFSTAEYLGRTIIKKPLLSQQNTQKRMTILQITRADQQLTGRKQITLTNPVFLFFLLYCNFRCGGKTGKFLIFTAFFPRVKHEGGSEIAWAAISWNSLNPIIDLHSRINNKVYLNILGNQFLTLLRKLFLVAECRFQDGNAPIHTSHVVKNWYEAHNSELQYIQLTPQSPDHNIIEHLQCILERQFRSRFPTQSCKLPTMKR